MDHNSMETFFGLIKTPIDALIIFEGNTSTNRFSSLFYVNLSTIYQNTACRLGVAARVHRRLSDIERQSVRSGSVYCFDEREAGMRRWTDGKSWSPSRVTGSFLTYRELDEAQGSYNGKYSYRQNGLLKQSFSITTADNQKLHLISYYTTDDVSAERLRNTPSTDPQLSKIVIPKGLYPETAVSDQPVPLTQSSPSPPMAHLARNSRMRKNLESLSPNGNLQEPRERRYKSSSPAAMPMFPTPPSNAYSPAASWVSDDDQPMMEDRAGATSSAAPEAIPGLRELPPIHQGFENRSKDQAMDGSEQDSLSVLANLAAHTMLLPKLEPKEVSRERVRWVEDDRQLRALSSMLRL
ncbi:hypothetical protein BGX24_000717 [Mortierella sp. AD032]|nr:hypothetical protein BGX24_000717 [Mortierella sp. AD032]